MTKKYLLPLALLALSLSKASAQTKMGNNPATISSTAILEIEDTTKGILIPRMSTTNRLAISSPPKGLLVYDSTQRAFYYYRNTSWTALSFTSASPGSYISDLDNNTKVETEKTSNEDKIRFTLAGTERWVMNGKALENNTGGTLSVGAGAGAIVGNNAYSAYFGEGAGHSNVSGVYNTGIGNGALYNNTGSNNTAVGKAAAQGSTTGGGNVVLGYTAMLANTTGGGNVVIGNEAFKNDTTGSGNVIIGANAAENTFGSNLLYISNSATTTPLLQGDFSTKRLIINDSLQSKFLTLTDGAGANYILQSDAAGHASWVSKPARTDTFSTVQDADRNTRIRTEATTNEDKIRFDLGGTEKWMMQGNRLEPKNTGLSVFVGESAGSSDDGTNRKNTAVGNATLAVNVTGSGNVAVGYSALFSNTGSSNTAVGHAAAASNTSGIWNSVVGQSALQGNQTSSYNTVLGGQALASHTSGDNNIGVGMNSLFSNQSGTGNVSIGVSAGGNNVSGSGNIFLGTQAGLNETSSNKLIIDNSSTSSPLIYGDFSTDSLRMNGSLAVTGIGGFVATGTMGSGNIPATGSGVRLMWYPKKAAFRAGQAVSSYWDDANTGSYSFATGSGTRATGSGSVATGTSTIAFGSNSLALGEGVVASAAYETALGSYNTSYTVTGSSTDHILSVGNGSFSAASNALTVLRSGNTGINTDAPIAPLSVITTSTAGTGGLVAQFGSTAIQGRIQLYDETLATNAGPKINFAASNTAQINGNGAIAVMPSTFFGVNTTSPASTLTVNGSIGVKRRGITANTTVTANDYIIAVTSTSALTVTLPDAGGAGAGRSYIIKAETLTAPSIAIVGTGSQTIDGSSSKTINTAAGVLRIYSDGANWWTF